MEHNIHRDILDNKMNLLLIPNHQTDTIAVGMFVKVGARYETKETNGISHFLEHMMFKGTVNYPKNKIPELLDSVGAIYNAETSYESTCYYIYGHKNDIKLFIDIISDIFLNPELRDDDIALEKGVVIEEFNMFRDDPQDIIDNMLHKTIFHHCSLKYAIIGTKENIMRFNSNDLRKFRDEYYIPERTIFVVSGNFDIDSVYNLIKNNMAYVSNFKSIALAPQTNKKINFNPKISVREHSNIAQTHIIIAFRSDSVYSKYCDIYELIAAILSSGSSSRLFNLLRNKLGVSYFTTAQNYAYSGEGIFCIQMAVDNKRVDEVIKEVLKEIKNLRKYNCITISELAKVKKIKTTAFSLALQTPVDLMNYYGTQDLFNNIGILPEGAIKRKDVQTRIRDFESISLEQVIEVSRSLFKNKNLNIIIYGSPPIF